MSGSRRQRLAALATAGSLALGASGCERLHPIGREKLDNAMSKAFKRASAAAYRMTTGRRYRSIVGYARFRCRPRGPEPTGDATRRWFCRVLWYRRQYAHHHVATYGVSVDKRGCFEATSANFAPRLHERVLDRSAVNPLVHIRSCP